MKSSKILITGGSGFVGANLIRSLINSKHEVNLLLRKKTNIWRINNILSQVNIYDSDLLDKKALSTIVAKIKPDYIFHLAAHGAYSSQTNLDEMIATNIIGLSNLLEASLAISYKCFVNTGSSSEYGYKQKPMKETDLLQPESFYAATKASATYLSQVFAKKYNKPIITFRLFSVFGPYEDPTRLIPTAITSALSNKTLALTSGIVKRDFIYVEDVVKAYLQTMKKKIKPGEIYNIGTGKQYSNDDVAKIIKSLNNNKLKIKKGAFSKRSWDTNYWIANSQHSKEDLSWIAGTPLKDGLKKTYDWFVENKEKYKKIYG
ncbi:MAG TPA: NAD-dependent epimerase/dehydratase family protein [Patescibacteria group bacterium]